MNALGLGQRAPAPTRNDQNWRETWNCSLTLTALAMSMVPSARSRRVVQLAQGRVAGSGVVPGVGALEGEVAEALVDLDVPVGLELAEEGSEGRAHDAATDECDVDGFTHWFSLISGRLVSYPPRDPARSAVLDGPRRTQPTSSGSVTMGSTAMGSGRAMTPSTRLTTELHQPSETFIA